MSDYQDPFGKSFDLPSFVHPDSFRRNVVPGPIPAPMLLTEPVKLVDLDYGNVVLYLNVLTVVYRSQDGMWVELRGYSNPDSTYLRTERNDMIVQRVRGVSFGLLSQEIPLEWLRDDSRTYFGKFDSQLSEYCWTQTFDGSEFVGDCDAMGFIAHRIDITQVDGTNYPLRTDSVIQQWADGPNDYPAGYIVTENDRGVVDVEFFDSVTDLDAEWNRLQELETELRGPDEDDCVINADGTVYFAGEILADVGDYDSEEDVYPLIRLAMDNHNFYPNVWRISDHGNAQIIDIGSEE